MFAQDRRRHRSDAGRYGRNLPYNGFHLREVHISAVFTGVVRIGIDADIDNDLARFMEICMEFERIIHESNASGAAIRDGRAIRYRLDTPYTPQ